MKPAIEVFWRFLLLGCVSFGGPAAHIGYFRTTFVEKLKWLDDDAYARLVALSQFLPGPGSSQVGFAIGVNRAGWLGGLAAFTGFTLPSFVLLTLLATLTLQHTDTDLLTGAIHGLKLLAVVVVADACLGMYRNFCKNQWTMAIAVLTAVALLMLPGVASQIVLLIFAAGFGIWQRQRLIPETVPESVHETASMGSINNAAQNSSQESSAQADENTEQNSVSAQSSQKGPDSVLKARSLWLFFALLLGLPLIAPIVESLDLFSRFYQAGSLVFGGGHVVLPLLQELVGESMDPDRFLTGYAAAQAVPGPMFTLASFLGADLWAESPVAGAFIATLGVFAPGLLLMYALQPHWEQLAAKPKMAAAVAAINAAVVGLLLSALYSPVFSSGVLSGVDMALVLLGFWALKQLKLSLLWIVAAYLMVGMIFF